MALNTQFPTWMLPKESPMDSLLKGVAAGSQMAATRQRGQIAYAQIQEFQQQQDLREREFLAENESRTLANEVHRTKLDQDTADFNTARDWYPVFAATPADKVSAIVRPTFHDTRRQEMAERAIAVKTAAGLRKRQMEGTSKLIGLTAEHPDPTDPALAKKAAEIFLEYNLTPEQWNQWENHQEHVQNIRLTRDKADAAIKERTVRLDQAQQRIDISFKNAETRAISVDDRRELGTVANELRALRLDPTTPYNAARIDELTHRHDLIAAKLANAPILSIADKAQVKALSTALTKADTELLTAQTALSAHDNDYFQGDKKKATAKVAAIQKHVTDLEAKLNAFSPKSEIRTPQSEIITPATQNVTGGTKYGPPAPSDGKVMVEKDGKQFWLPSTQLQDALGQGYNQVQ